MFFTDPSVKKEEKEKDKFQKILKEIVKDLKEVKELCTKKENEQAT